MTRIKLCRAYVPVYGPYSQALIMLGRLAEHRGAEGWGVRENSVRHKSQNTLAETNTWEFPKIGDPNYITLNSRILIIRTPKERYP